MKRTLFFCLAVWLVSVSVLAGGKVRPFLQTGNWYPGNRSALSELMNELFAGAAKSGTKHRPLALIVPHAGLRYSGRCTAEGFSLLKGWKIDRVIILGVAHRAALSGACVSDFAADRTPLGDIPVDTRITSALGKLPGFQVNDRIVVYEHSIENELPFLQHVLKGRKFKIVPVLFGSVSRGKLKEFARELNRYVTETTVVVVSSDLTHYGENYGYVPFSDHIPERLKKLDMGFLKLAMKLDVNGLFRYRRKTGITACGFVPISVLMEMMKGKHVSAKLVDYYRSGDENGDYSLSVSYGAVVFERKKAKGEDKKMNEHAAVPRHISHENRVLLLKLARKALEAYTSSGKRLDVDLKNYPKELLVRRSVFVTLNKNGNLRGCIGNLGEGDLLPISVRDYTVNAAASDPRFRPVQHGEVKDIDIEISVMTPFHEIPDYHRIRLGIDGVIISKGFYRAVFLPQVATETGWNLDQFLSHLCVKAGLPADAYKEPGMTFSVFQAEVFSEGSELK
ncbi:MAG: AmmeMemoRadiSam system protein B [Acidobacteria bacterium]|nr:AmmeMemoRadiSam system protein B [Acidobacteriota bacterium]